ncbi:sigma-70 family RNA polymerase sigma factor [Dysgonomonas sp. 216]|uniref:RNA polymerase sigma factor n=1 Tax=Dysgonomonas sp. 216 TaxID=2302934 RepID=UPI0013D6B73B|nr:sigma-70 family RNA polymerase sigma factor [Dysgonomonas sp. 216]NDW18370.1 sigma-70 family RNA polymerase sigma factor [Dysgonomonas sp. 216]
MTAEGFKQQYLPYHQKLYHIAFRLLENTFEAEDVIQDAYIKLWDKRGELHSIQNCEAYCVQIVKNMCLDVLRSKRNKVSQLSDDVSMHVDVANSVEFSERIDMQDDLEHVKYLIDLLPEQQRRVFVLKHYEEYSTEEIEEITGLTNIHIRVLLSRGRKRLKELFINR